MLIRAADLTLERTGCIMLLLAPAPQPTLAQSATVLPCDDVPDDPAAPRR
jgi:hypothetical protein